MILSKHNSFEQNITDLWIKHIKNEENLKKYENFQNLQNFQNFQNLHNFQQLNHLNDFHRNCQNNLQVFECDIEKNTKYSLHCQNNICFNQNTVEFQNNYQSFDKNQDYNMILPNYQNFNENSSNHANFDINNSQIEDPIDKYLTF